MKASALFILFAGAAVTALAQDDITTRNAASGYDGAYITGPASNPLSFLNGGAYRTFARSSPYLLPDFAPASRLNEKLPNWIQFAAEERLRFEGYHNSGFKLNNDDSYSLNRLRIQMTLQFRPWLKVVSQVQDARPFLQKPPYGPPNEVRWDLKLAYAEFGDPEKQWVSLRAGRQLISYNNTIIANSEWRNQGRSFDAVVANLHFKRYRLGIFAASAVNPRISGVSHHQDGNNIYGLYGTIDKIFPNSDFEPFVLWRVAPGNRDEKAYGGRLKGLLGTDLDYTYEAVLERGNVGTSELKAWGQTFGAGYRFQKLWAHPRAFAQYDYASPAFDTMYPTAHDRFGISDQFGWQNIVAGRAGLTLEPRRRWSITAQYLDFWLASATDPLFNTSGGSVVRDARGRAGKHIGEEVDVYTWFELNRHLNFGVGVAHLMPGSFLAANTTGPAYNYPCFAINFKDDGKSKREPKH
ncbi:MAG: alginate export family protein [Terriglobia bacterium]